jgi:hypothetical protein
MDLTDLAIHPERGSQELTAFAILMVPDADRTQMGWMKEPMVSRFAWLAVALLAACGGEDETAPPVQETRKTPEEVLADKAGTYQGNWELFGRATDGTVSSAMTWTDVAVADRPTVEAERAYLEVVDTMTMSTGMEIVQQWIEGVIIDRDGKVGQQFIEMEGVVTLLDEIEPDHFQYETPIADTDFFFIQGVTPQTLTAGHHLVDKVVTHPDGKETHSIHRTTHLEWTDAMGMPQTADYESLVGTHTKTE